VIDSVMRRHAALHRYVNARRHQAPEPSGNSIRTQVPADLFRRKSIEEASQHSLCPPAGAISGGFRRNSAQIARRVVKRGCYPAPWHFLFTSCRCTWQGSLRPTFCPTPRFRTPGIVASAVAAPPLFPSALNVRVKSSICALARRRSSSTASAAAARPSPPPVPKGPLLPRRLLFVFVR